MLLMSLSCSKSDDDEVVTPLNDYTTQRDADRNTIETYLDTHYLNLESVTDISSVVNSADLIKKLPTTGTIPPSIFSLLGSTTYPKLLTKEVEDDGIKYLVYYLVFNEGNTTEKPCPFDEVLVTYRGTSLEKVSEGVVSATEFDKATLGVKFPLNSLVGGWREIIPFFGKGTFDEVATGNGPNVYTNYGAGIMFLPSGLGYFNGNGGSALIKSYSPLVFSFQLQNFIRIDNDNDGIMTVDELAVNSEGKYADTDGDGIYDFGDLDDDNDGYTTRNEIKKPTPLGINQGTSLYYPFNPIIDNPLTTDIDESEPKGIPDKSGDFSTPTRVRRHLDKTAKPPYTTY